MLEGEKYARIFYFATTDVNIGSLSKGSYFLSYQQYYILSSI